MKTDQKCPVMGCENIATTPRTRGRITMLVCDNHADHGPIIEPIKLDKATTGCKDVDRDINYAVDSALLRLKPIIRDVIREELKRVLNVEQDTPPPPQPA